MIFRACIFFLQWHTNGMAHTPPNHNAPGFPHVKACVNSCSASLHNPIQPYIYQHTTPTTIIRIYPPAGEPFVSTVSKIGGRVRDPPQRISRAVILAVGHSRLPRESRQPLLRGTATAAAVIDRVLLLRFSTA